jgi:hypothetical protein
MGLAILNGSGYIVRRRWPRKGGSGVRRRPYRRVSVRLAVGFVLMAGTAGGIASSAQGAAAADWTMIQGYTIPHGQLQGVAAISARDAWAVGQVFPGETTLTLQWNGETWNQVPSPGAGILNGVAATSAGNAWAVGQAGQAANPRGTLILHWNGSTWGRVHSPMSKAHSSAELNAVTATSARYVWAVGATGGANFKNLILRYNGTAWKQVPSPNPVASDSYLLSGVAATSASSAWAAGSFAPENRNIEFAEILHWNGQAWHVSRWHGPATGSALSDVAATSPRNAWAVGETSLGPPLMLHWNGKAWKNASAGVPDNSVMYGVVAASARHVWAVGQTLSGKSLIVAWTGRRWRRVSSAALEHDYTLFGVAATSARNAWAVGYDESFTGLIVHWDGAGWH